MSARLVNIVSGIALVAVGTHSALHSSSPQATVPPVRIDAVVTGALGHAIPGLRASDFEVREDGSPRPVSAAHFRWVQRHSSVEVLPIETRLDEERAARQPGTRVFAFFLDEFHVSPGASADRAREAVASFLDEKVYERDLAAVIRPLDSVSSVRFTRDRPVLHGSIAGFAGRKGDYAPRTPMEEQHVGRDPAGVRAARQRIVRASLRELGVRLSELNADWAVLVLLSEGFPPDPTAPDGRLSDLWSLVRASSQFHFSIYTFNPAGPGEDAAPAGDRERASATLQWLAAETGGLFVPADAFIAGFARVFHDTHGYYALTYHPAYADARFHRLEVRTRGKANVRTRAGYWATATNEWSAPVSVPPAGDPVTRRLLRRGTLIDAWIGVRRDAAGGAHMVITWEPRRGQRRLAQTVVIKARTVTGTPVFEGAIEPVGGGSRSANESARFDVPAGRVEVDMTVLDADGTVVDTDARDFDVPDLRLSRRPGLVLLPTEIVRVRTLRELQTAISSSDATPSSARTFARGNQLLIRVPAFDPTGSAVLVTARVLSRTGQPMRSIEASDGLLADGVTQFVLPLNWLAPGPYQIELSGTSPNGTARERVAFQIE
jgi:VWFA-related protein